MTNFTFDEASHTYRLNGQIIPSVTRIIDAFLPQFRCDEYYLARGTAMHYGCRLLDEGRLDWSTVAPEIEPRIRAWEKFRKDFGAKVMFCEKALASSTLRYAGCLDRLFNVDGVMTICDIKSSYSPQAILQLGAYSLLVKENNSDVGPSKGVIVEVREDGCYVCKWLTGFDLRHAEQQFKALLSIYQFAEKHGL